ncbi:MAG: hypothetical protein C0606_08700 [Hyphomicrobiales bacterium]|nr:MAG: hypothetical protein C0606_08700 [Hyphomicrobiales bacterium]
MKRFLSLFPIVLAVVFGFAAPAAAVAKSDGALLAELRAATSDEVAADILEALAERHSEPVRVALEALITDEMRTDTVRMQAICALGGSATSESVPLLLAVLEEDLEKRRGFWACAIPVLGQIGDRRAVPLLKTIGDLNEEHLAGMDHMAIAALASFAGAEDVDYLERKAQVWGVRRAVFSALARIASPSSADILVAGLSSQEEAEIIDAAMAGLLAIGPAARPALKAALNSEGGDDAFRARVEELLKLIN